MKVILIKDVEKLGEIGDIVEVAAGYGRNFLIPKGFAMMATAKNKRQLEHEQRLREYRIAQARKEAETFAGSLQAISCHFTRKTAEEGRLFGSVTAMDIAEKLKEAGYAVERRLIQLEQPIKSVGEFTVPVRLRNDVSAMLKVTVAAEE
jgi:large subunit ribosomal protein L9